MGTEEGFLARWSRRKRGAAQDAADRPSSAEPAPAGADSSAPPLPGQATEPAQPIVDPATLPPVESIGADSDVSAFLAQGVPAELTRAALRRAWTADPAIRDFVGLSENAWDFTAPDGVPGFGPLSPEEASRLLAQAMEATQPAASPEAASAAAGQAPSTAGAAVATDGASPKPLTATLDEDAAARREDRGDKV
jgi:hypothetical protein